MAIVDAFDDPNAESDLAVYRAKYGLPECTTADGCFKKVNQTGGSKYPSAEAGWSVEISLDLDMASAACPKCHLLLVEAESNSGENLYSAEDEAATLGASEISDSWDGEEFSEEHSYDTYFNHPGIPITVAAGDSGYKVGYPAASPDVIAVGGTALSKAANARGWSEVAWSKTGSGCSAYEPKPSWQTDKGCTRRTDNDVAAVASAETPVSVADSYELPKEFSVPQPGWTLVAGTSVASPLVAGTMALASAYTRSFAGADALYLEASQNGTGVLDDVVSGSNGRCRTYLCNAAVGYDGPTGLGSLYGPPVVVPPIQQEPQGSWLGKYGSSGYDLADWDGVGDVSDLGGASLSVLQGSRYQWAANTTDVRGLQSPDGLARSASTYYDPSELKLQLSFPSGYTGNLRLYALDWDSTARRETITVNGQTAELSSEFHNGVWVTFPVNISAGGTATITVKRTAGANAVLSGIFLGEGAEPPNPTVSSAPQGGWVGAVGSSGYDLAGWDGATGDVSYLPNASLNLVQGTRFQWAANTTETRALLDPGGLVRNAGTYYDPNQIKLTLSFPSGYTGNVHLYALDWDSTARRELITVNGQSAMLSSSFHEGAWVTLPVNVPAGGTATITVDRTAGANAVLSGMFLGEGGTPPNPAVSSAPQGSWVGVHGAGGYDLAAWGGTSDLVSLAGGASVSLIKAARYVWAASSTDARALQAPSGPEREAATYYDPNEIQLQLTFPGAYSGSLELYAIDWDSTVRREVVTVNGQTAALSSPFNEGAWVTLPVNVPSGGTATITVDRTAGANAVLSGVFLG